MKFCIYKMLGPYRKSSWTLGRENCTLVLSIMGESETSSHPRIEVIRGHRVSTTSREVIVGGR